MATQKRNTVDYFPHLIGTGKKMNFIENRHGNNGYATWFKILENLAITNNHFLDLNDELEVSYLATKCKVQESQLLAIIEDLVKIRVFDEKLWKVRVIWCQTFVDNIQDAYKRRASNCMTYEELCKHLANNGYDIACNMHTSCIHNDNNEPLNSYKNPYIKEEYIKEDKSRGEGEEKKVDDSVVPDESKSDIPKPNAWGTYESLDDLKEVLQSSKIWKDELGQSLGISNPDDVPKWIDKFFVFAKAAGADHKTQRDAKSHCHNWIRRQIELGKTVDEPVKRKAAEQPVRLSAIARANLRLEELKKQNGGHNGQ
ncbi:DUF4373 domain-containing protein [Olivibacter sp. LS-1]|uniref:DUF7833 domain-containing protein n=1 Tax=Olivibacter sp. LS-1 TaxID=2592345 RepID=UPI0011EAC8AC|nr:Lin1244/Lin1753 domain-containing protein [Olivibacter sp. LS-1]QEL01561.1 DUF4373 domain-containing protein [Olivibacter sp. LS-1]